MANDDYSVDDDVEMALKKCLLPVKHVEIESEKEQFLWIKHTYGLRPQTTIFNITYVSGLRSVLFIHFMRCRT